MASAPRTRTAPIAGRTAVFVREQGDLPSRAVGLKTPQTGGTVPDVGFGGSAGVGGFAGVGGAARAALRAVFARATCAARSDRFTGARLVARGDRCATRAPLGLTLGLAAVVALAMAASASAADDPLGAATQGAASAAGAAAAPVTTAAAPAATTATAGATDTATATTAAAQTATKAVHPPAPPTDREVSDTVRSAGAAVDSAVRTVKRTADAGVATTTHVVDSAQRPPASSAPASTASRAKPALKVESSHARPPSRHPGVKHDRTAAEPHASQATAARALDRTAPTTTQRSHAVASVPSAAGGQHAANPQPASPSAPALSGTAAAAAGAAASGAGPAALLLAIFLLAAPAIRRRLHAPPSGHRPAAPVFLLERPG
jgi:hypothetical protein